MISENPPSRLRQSRGTLGLGHDNHRPAAATALPRVADSPNRETATPLTTLGGVELETDVVSDRCAAERATMATGSPAVKVLV
jgi:hypothetical protein